MTQTEEAVPRSLQLRFEAIERSLPETRPLVSLKTVMDLLGCDEDRAKYLYESPWLRFAFNLGDVSSKRMEVRIYRGSLMEYARRASVGDYSFVPSDKNEGLADVIRDCLPQGQCRLTAAGLHGLWGISSTHLHDLISAGAMAIVPGQELKAKQSPLLVRSSVVEFLKSRRIT